MATEPRHRLRRAQGRSPSGTGGFTGLALLIYGGSSLAGAVAFFLVATFTDSYPGVARYGGTAWVFVLLMIVLMPVVIPRVRRKKRQPANEPKCPRP